MASATSVMDNVVREEIAQGIREMRPDLDPVWSEIITTSFGVEREGLGRTWRFRRTFCSGISGAYEFVSNATMLGGTIAADNAAVKGFGAGGTWPGRTRSTAPAFPQSVINLVEARGNIFVPMQWLQLDQFDSTVGSAFQKLITGAAFKASLAHATAFYTSSTSNFEVVKDLAVSASADNHTITIDNSNTTQGTGRIQMLQNGSLVDIFTTTVKQNNNPWFVSQVDYLNNKFTIRPMVSGDSDVDIALGDYLTLAGSRGNQPEGLRSWMVTAGSGTKVLDSSDGLDTGDHPEFGSLLVTESGPATEKILTKHIGTFDERIGTMVKLDTIITTAGVTHSYLENEDNLARYERNGRRLEVKGGWADIDYGYHGKGFRWAISSFSEPKTIFVIKTGDNNIREYVPPSIPGAGSHGEFANEVQFVAQIGGATSIWFHERDSSALITDVMEAPYLRQCQLNPEFPQGIIIDGLDESTTN